MGAASASVAGKAGLVPAPPAGKQGQFLRGDATWAVPYTHPTTSGNKHIPSGGAAGQVLGYAAAGTAAWKTLTAASVGAAASSHTHDVMTAATASAAGKSGMVPVPVAGAQAKYLRGDGTWATPPTSSYTHPTTAGYKHIPAGGESGQVLGYSEDGTAAWTTLTASNVGAAPSSHTHDDRYYTETEVKNLIDATFLTKTFTGAKVSIAGKTAKAITITCATPSGYTAIGGDRLLYRAARTSCHAVWQKAVWMYTTRTVTRSASHPRSQCSMPRAEQYKEVFIGWQTKMQISS